MSRRAPARTMKAIVEVRSMQRRSAEIEVGAAAKALADAALSRREGLEALLDNEAQWSKAVEGRSLGLGAAALWSAAVSSSEAELRRMDLRVSDAEAAASDRRTVLSGALAREEAAESLSAAAARRAGRLREEAALGEIADRFARRRRP